QKSIKYHGIILYIIIHSKMRTHLNDISGYLTLKTCMSFVAVAAAFLFVSTPAVSFEPGPAWAQITPSTITPDLSDTASLGPQSSVLPEILPESSGIGFVAQDTADPIQNNTASNITQLATVPSTVNQPIAPASLTPVVEESDESSSSSGGSGGDDEDENDGNDGNDGGDGGDGDGGDGGDGDGGDGGDGDGGDGGDDGDGGDGGMFDGAFDGGFPFD
ncbi:MAG: hypothetical protein WAM26_09495, partial [Nitrososphaeraceae archaeon]